MANNEVMVLVKDQKWLNGFGNLFRHEINRWWSSWRWLVQILIWLVVINGMLVMVLVAAPKIEAARGNQELTAAEAELATASLAQTGLMVFFIFSGMGGATGAVILGQDALIQERQVGTASWIFSKPVSPAAYFLAKFSATAIGVLVSMVLVQGAAAYFIYRAGTGIALPAAGFAAGLGLVFLLLLFYVTLTLMLGTVFHSRGPVIGIPVLVIFGSQLTGLVPWLGKVLPWNLVMDLGPGQPALGVLLSQNQPLPTIAPIIGTSVLLVIFAAAAIWRLSRQEY